MNDKAGNLYVVGTPIGNLEDITFRAIRILQEVDIIAAEDTRHTGKLLQHFQIITPQISYHKYNCQQRQEELLTRLLEGDKIALVTDAGMPSISDPGCELVAACLKQGIKVIPLPGANAAVTALSVAGMNGSEFVFAGFLPTKNKERQTHLETLKNETRTIIFYEAPHRLVTTLQDLAKFVGENREIFLGRELTKLHEECIKMKLGEAIAFYREKTPKGEFTLVMAGAATAEKLTISESELKVELQQMLAQGMTRSQAARQLAQVTNLSRRQIYQLDLD
ncbi:16S rRNA (cytidine(1402)-2'-O)-methyltransferase [Oscillatoria salina]|uniref:16S rRNA (cytidine(1402)-2'-O)-methyltransferase n=1 Tax=Oscillatoria salina TaxID=331517 RepID=UPI0013B97F39|nr:16S rRNA (cytidine(1402)-2'-O)-methyltransferase [Oscillatoria salina]MBZ8182005.1 16S rRNA (cytidine(1402)-2'-O)-methyltransferase [Oscillatoria salina IIICB1]NET89388.1 16S rRNA (cytidine(1402)-2'-O)-methyltransferase [Kamptonema sp. SIO1D9]